MRRDVVGIGEPHRQEHRRRLQLVDHFAERVGDLLGLGPLLRLQVLVVDEVQPAGTAPSTSIAGAVLYPAQRDDVVTGLEAAERVPLRGRIRIRAGRTAEEGDHRRAGMREQEVRRAERSIVEMR